MNNRGKMNYILGIDQGASNTRAAVMDSDGNILGYGKTHGTYFPRDGMSNSLEIISNAVDNARINANVKIKNIRMIVVGITGIDYEGDDVFVRDEFKKFFGVDEVHAFNDCVIAYYGGTTDEVGAVLCAGTGINAAFFTPDNKIWVMSDYLKASLQGGSAIARRAAEALFESEIGLWPDTKLKQIFLELADADTVDEVLKKYILDYDFSIKMTKYIPKQIIKIAGEGDEVAQMVLKSFSDELCTCFLAAMKKKNMLDLNCKIVLAGSVYKGSDSYLRTVTIKTLRETAHNAEIVNAVFEPVVGACVLGVHKATGKFDNDMLGRAIDSANKFGLDRV